MLRRAPPAFLAAEAITQAPDARVLCDAISPDELEGRDLRHPPAAAARVVVGTVRDYPPYEFVDEGGEPQGYNVALTRAIAEVMGMSYGAVRTLLCRARGEMRRALAEEGFSR